MPRSWGVRQGGETAHGETSEALGAERVRRWGQELGGTGRVRLQDRKGEMGRTRTSDAPLGLRRGQECN